MLGPCQSRTLARRCEHRIESASVPQGRGRFARTRPRHADACGVDYLRQNDVNTPDTGESLLQHTGAYHNLLRMWTDI
ncbi:hypothetical protein [Burkholderia sp. LMG 21824]|uniref:hypothetical protein n=1 Tax=Burkholderia sp. LMG 21824 TaxID=3158172 RepID=UPI003C2FD385